jgi:hypothetical protein
LSFPAYAGVAQQITTPRQDETTEMTPLDKTLKRSLNIKGVDYVLTLSPEALKLTRKGRRIGMELKWVDITSGQSALAAALQASLGSLEEKPREAVPLEAVKEEQHSKRRKPAQLTPSPEVRKRRPRK